MKKITNYIVIATLVSLLVTASTIGAGGPCDKVRGTGHTFATGPATFQGTAIVNTGSGSEAASVTTSLLGPPKVGDDGTLLAQTSHTLIFGDGSSITTLDNAVLGPTEAPGLYNLNTRAGIVQGSGRFAAACGSLSIHGTISLTTGEVIWRFTGHICDCE